MADFDPGFMGAMTGAAAGPMMDTFQAAGDAFGGAVADGGLEAGGDAFMDTFTTAIDGGAIPGMTTEVFEGAVDTFMDNMDFDAMATRKLP